MIPAPLQRKPGLLRPSGWRLVGWSPVVPAGRAVPTLGLVLSGPQLTCRGLQARTHGRGCVLSG